MSTKLTFGKYSGLTYEQVLTYDLPYCEFINRTPENMRTKEFKEWLVNNIERGTKNNLDKKLEILMKRVSK
jgi:hypothetical protein